MTTNHTRYTAKVSLFLGLVVAACLFAAAAHANSLFRGQFTLTSKVVWGEAVLPPGEYVVTLDLGTHTIIVSDANDGKYVARMDARIDPQRDSGASELLIANRGSQRAVCALRVAGLGELYQTAHPFPTHGRFAEEARQTEAVPVLVAKN